MRTIRVTLAIAMACLWGLANPAFCGLIQRRNVAIPDFSAISLDVAIDISATLVSTHYANLANMTAQLGHLLVAATGRTPNAAAARRAVCLSYALAGLGASQAAPVMLKGIAMSPAWPGQLGLGISLPMGWGKYPMVSFLTEVGMPSVRAILKLLPHEPNALRRRLMVKVLVGVEGRAVTRFRLRRLVAKAATASEKANLKAALADVAQVKSR